MINFDKKELLKLAKLSALKLYDLEIENLVNDLKKLLEYTEELNEVLLAKEVDCIKNINVFREDKAIPKDSTSLLKQAPELKNRYFVVPPTLKKNKLKWGKK